MVLGAQVNLLTAPLLLSSPPHPWCHNKFKITFMLPHKITITSIVPQKFYNHIHGATNFSHTALASQMSHLKDKTFQVSKLGLKPLARIVGYGDAAVEPVDWPVAPALGVKQMLDRY